MSEDRVGVFGGRFHMSHFTYGNQIYERKIWKFRNELRKRLDPLDNHLKWLVSDITVSAGDNGTYHQIYAFIVRHMDGAGSPTGPEWLFMFTNSKHYGFEHFDGSHTWRFFGGTTSTTNNFLNTEGSNGSVNSARFAHLAIHYNPYSGLGGGNEYKLGFVDFNNAKYSNWHTIFLSGNSTSFTAGETILVELNSGAFATAIYRGRWDTYSSSAARFFVEDLSNFDIKQGGIIKDQATELKSATIMKQSFDTWPVLFNGDFIPYNYFSATKIYNWSTFHPQTTPNSPYGLIFRYPWGYNSGQRNYNVMICIFDWNKPFMALYQSRDISGQLVELALFGKIITPYNVGGDPNGVIHFGLFSDYDEFGRVDRCSISTTYDTFGTSIGHRTTMSRVDINNFSKSFSSTRLSDNKFPFNPMQIYNTNELKGYADLDVIREIGAYNDDPYRLFSAPNGPFIKLSRNHAFPWATGFPVIPPIPWNQSDYNDPGGILDDFDY